MDDPLLVRLGSRLDRLPLSPTQLGSRLIKAQLQAAKRRAGADPLWRTWMAVHGDAELLSWDAVERQAELLDRHRRGEWLTRLGHAAREVTFRSGAQFLVTRWQLVRRGWASEDTWSLRGVLAQRLGAQLLHFADVTNGWLGTDEFPDLDAWRRALRQAGGALQAYAAAYLYELPDEDVERIRREAREALHWVADHLDHLWW